MSEQVSVTDGDTVLAADGQQALAYRVDAASGEVRLESLATITPANLHDEGPSGVRPPEQTEQQTDEATFAKQLANWLDRQITAGEIERFILFADPQTLGQVRDAWTVGAEKGCTATVDKRVVNDSAEQLAGRLALV